MERRAFLAASALGVVSLLQRVAGQDSVPATGPAGRLYDPAWAGPSVQPVTARDNDVAIQAIEKRIKCTCGCGLDVYTCRTTDFECPVSPKMHAQVLSLAGEGKSGDQIIAEFVREHGIEILMAPPKTGFNLVGYLTPGGLLLAAGAVLVLAMRRWVRRAAPSPVAVDVGDRVASASELESLREALLRTDA
jgi:cytochrome c-type biogenesis protein CcmH/NrfF